MLVTYATQHGDKDPREKRRMKGGAAGGDQTRAGPVSSLREQDNPPLPHSPLTSDTNLHSTLTEGPDYSQKQEDTEHKGN